MVKYTIHNDFYSIVMTILHKFLKVIVCTESPVNHLIIGSFISVSDRFKQRSDINCRTSDISCMGCPLIQFVEMLFWHTGIFMCTST